ncbi:MAG: ABC transporter permease [Deltaproteobacteria bacterium]|nr:ABC transporter permease [Deltaproteobacteria bacterium]MBW2045015.1 ABC transporter permease [Deltaproteobacteria bacterium]
MKRRGKRRKILTTFLKNKTSLVGACICVAMIFIAVLASWVSPYDPLKQNVYHRLTPPEQSHLLGTDEYGRDVLSRIFTGTRISFFVSIISIILGMAIGTGMGMLAGYAGGKVETALMRALDIMMSFPDEVFGVMVMIVLGTGVENVIIAITILMIPRFARMGHAPTLALKEQDYITAAKSIGASDSRVLIRHVLPNIFGEILVMSTLWLGTAIRLEASLSFLGVGVPPPTPTLGSMVRDGVDFLGIAPWVSVFAGLAILVSIFGFNLLGDGLRDITDPKLYAR